MEDTRSALDFVRFADFKSADAVMLAQMLAECLNTRVIVNPAARRSRICHAKPAVTRKDVAFCVYRLIRRRILIPSDLRFAEGLHGFQFRQNLLSIDAFHDA